MEILSHFVSSRFIAARRISRTAISRLTILLLVFLFPVASHSSAQTARATDLKAVFLFNFAHFVDWPPEAFATENSPFIIGVLGEDPFGETLETVVRDETVNQRPIVVQRYPRLRDLQPCHILYVSESMNREYLEALAAVHGKPVLTVGETAGFAQSGGIVRFVRDGNRINFVINNDAARAVSLRISSQVLRAARIVESTD